MRDILLVGFADLLSLRCQIGNNPLVPSSVERLQHLTPFFLLADSVVDRVYGNELEVFEGPVVGQESNEVVTCRVLQSELAGVIGTQGHWIAETQQNRRRGFSEIVLVP